MKTNCVMESTEKNYIMKRSVSMRMILPGKKKNNNNIEKKNKILITVNVLGSPGPLRFVVNEDDKVSAVINSSLKLYARGGRLPLIGLDFNNFVLYSSNEGSAMNSSEEIGSCGGRNFVLCKKRNNSKMGEARSQMMTPQRDNRRWTCILCLAQ